MTELQKKPEQFLEDRAGRFAAAGLAVLMVPTVSGLLLPAAYHRYCFLAVFIILIALVVAAYVRLYIPYMKYQQKVRLLADGFILPAELAEMDVQPNYETERMMRQIDQALRTVSTLDLSKRQAQYRALQNQINPHFLYNTLEGIRSEALIAGMDQLADMTESLAIFFRYTISKVENLVTLEEELDNCRTYFKIQQYRFGNRLHLAIDRDEDDWEEMRHLLLPKLTLQPILENSIIHGIELKLGEGKITIQLYRTDTRLNIIVRDDGVGMDLKTLNDLNAKLSSKEEELKDFAREDRGGGVALVNVNNRIHLIFGEEYGMHVYSMTGVGTEVELSLPLITSEKQLQQADR